jgi:hypothetical protein
MRVLLVGDYSGVHYNLWVALRALNIDVTLISDGDGSKEIPTQLSWRSSKKEGKYKKYINMHGVDFLSINKDMIESCRGFDIVQIVNPVICESISSKFNLDFFSYLKMNNKKIFMYSVGDDLRWVSYHLFSNKTKSMFNDKRILISRESFHPLRYILYPGYRKLCKLVYSGVNAIIPGSLDYYLANKGFENVTKIVPFPLDISALPYREKNNYDSFTLFHGIQKGKGIRKGYRVFEEIKKMVSDNKKIKIINVESVPYNKYINLLADSDIVFDQSVSYDQGMNAVLAMAMGKVVFSGFEKEFYEYYDLNHDIGINANFNSAQMLTEMLNITNDREKFERISQSAREFVVDKHDHIKVAKEFIAIWNCY